MDLSRYKILLVDDEKDIIEFLTYTLKKEDFVVYSAKNGKEAIEITKTKNPHLVLLDVMMPEMDGIETCERLRELPVAQNTIIAFLTARSEDYSQIAGFKAGGDDYISKPVKPRVLVSRIKALLKRYGNKVVEIKEEEQVLKYGNLEIDLERYLVINEGHELHLPKKEFNLLLLLTSKPSKVFSRDEIFHRLWGNDIYVGDRTIDVYVRKLREKIGLDRIKTVKGVGYKFEVYY